MKFNRTEHSRLEAQRPINGLVFVFVCLIVPSLDASDFASKPLSMTEIEVETIRFQVPTTMHLEQIAAQPLIRWPVAAAWDHDRTLLVLESNWNRESVEQQLQSRPHRIVRLTDIDHDGRFDLRTMVAEKLSFSAGLLVIDEDTLLVSAPPRILQLDDRDGDGVYESESTWHDGRTITHCANDLHGPMMGRDGWIYWTKGAFAEQSNTLRDGKLFTSKAAHMFRRHPRGGEVEVLMTGGMDNPVDIAFLPDGERLFCSTFMHHPGGGVRDGIGHAVYGAMFGKPHDVLNGHPRTGPLMEPIEELGPAAPASLTQLTAIQMIRAAGFESTDLSEEAFVTTCQFNLQKVSLHRVSPLGSTFATESQDILVGNKVDFHPVDVLEDFDGSLIVLDTGGWYDLCCPSSGTPGQVAPGGIYRLGPQDKPTRSELSSDVPARVGQVELIDAVGNEQISPVQRLACFWQLVSKLVNETDKPAIRKLVLESLNSPCPSLQRAALHTVSLYRWQESEATLLELLKSGSSMTRRLSAECLGRLRGNDKAVTTVLMNAICDPSNDRTLDHAILYAMIERSAANEVRPYLTSDRSRHCWAAMMVLEQTGKIQQNDALLILDHFASDDQRTSRLALETIAAHPEFSIGLMDRLIAAWKEGDVVSQRLLSGLLEQWWEIQEIQSQVGQWLAMHSSFTQVQDDLMLETIGNVRGEALPESWVEPITDWMAHAEAVKATRLAASLTDVKWDEQRDRSLISTIIARANRSEATTDDPQVFVSALPLATEGLDAEVIQAIVAGLTSDDQSKVSSSLQAISHVKLPVATAMTLIEQLGTHSPVTLQPLMLAILAVNDTQVDAALLESFSHLTSAKTVSTSALMNALANRSKVTREEWSSTFEILSAPPEDVSRTVTEWIEKLPDGDPILGHEVFRSSKAACVQCHQVGYVGGKIGPELSKIGRSRTRRDLVEAIIFPSARLEQSYRSTRFLLTDGRVLNGLLATQTGANLELICGATERCFVSLKDVEAMEPSEVSIMPAGLEQSLTLQQFADLIAFLESSR